MAPPPPPIISIDITDQYLAF